MEATICYKKMKKEFTLKQRELNKRYGKADDEVEVEKRLSEYDRKRRELLDYVLGKRN